MADDPLVDATRRLAREADPLHFDQPITHVYNPLNYAWDVHRAYLQRFGAAPKRVVFLGMNPGPWGMAQTGVPFGEVEAVRNWLGLKNLPIGRPANEHPKHPVKGLNTARREVSGRRLWSLFQDRFKTPDRFFQDHFVVNYCPLLFLEASGRNHTPDKLPVKRRGPLLEACDAHLRHVLDHLKPSDVVAVGAFAERCARRVIGERKMAEGDNGEGSDHPRPRVTRILHPSPASPAANRDWAGSATGQLQQSGVWN